MLDGVFKTNFDNAAENVVWTAMQKALKKQHRLELMILRTAAALSGYHVGILSSSSDGSNTSYPSSPQSKSPPAISKIPDVAAVGSRKNSDVEEALSSGQESTTTPSQSNDERFDSLDMGSMEVVNLSSDEEDSSEESTSHDRIVFSPKPVAPGELAVPIPAWLKGVVPYDELCLASIPHEPVQEVVIPMPCWALNKPPLSTAPIQVAPGSVQVAPSHAAVEPPPNLDVAFKAVLGLDIDSLQSAEPAPEPALQTANTLTTTSASTSTSTQTPETTSEDISQLMLQMVGVRKGHQEQCANKLSSMNFLQFR